MWSNPIRGPGNAVTSSTQFGRGSVYDNSNQYWPVYSYPTAPHENGVTAATSGISAVYNPSNSGTLRVEHSAQDQNPHNPSCVAGVSADELLSANIRDGVQKELELALNSRLRARVNELVVNQMASELNNKFNKFDDLVLQIKNGIEEKQTYQNSKQTGVLKYAVDENKHTETMIKGSAAPRATPLEEAEPWKRFYLYYLNSGPSEEQVGAHLRSLCDYEACTAEAREAKGDLVCYSLGVPTRLASKAVDPKSWPKGVCIAPWFEYYPDN